MRSLGERFVTAFAELATHGGVHWPIWARMGLAVALIGLSTALRLAIAPQAAGLPYVAYFPAATLAAVFGGIGAGAAATVLGALVGSYMFIPPFNELKFDQATLVSALVFCADEMVVFAAIEAMRRYYRKSMESARALTQAHAAETAARLAAERANEAKSRFLASASHDLRQPYQALRLCHAALENPRLAEPAKAAILANMDEAMNVGETLLTKLLELSVLDAGMVVPQPKEMPISELLTDVASRHRAQAEAEGLRLRVRAAPGMVRTDPTLLARVLDNLLANAIRYTRRGGVLVAYRMRRGVPMVEVWDTGIGIAPEHQDAVFEEFFQIGNSARDRRKGLGLGLAVVERTAHLLGWRVEMASRPGTGTRFRVVLT